MIDHLGGKWLVVCIDNKGNEASLEQWKIYQSLPDEEAEKHHKIRVIDEEGGDYLSGRICRKVIHNAKFDRQKYGITKLPVSRKNLKQIETCIEAHYDETDWRDFSPTDPLLLPSMALDSGNPCRNDLAFIASVTLVREAHHS